MNRAAHGLAALWLLCLPAAPPVAAAHGYSLEDAGCGGGPYPDNAAFSIVGDSLRTGAATDFDAKPAYTLCVRTTDGGGETHDEELTVTVTDTFRLQNAGCGGGPHPGNAAFNLYGDALRTSEVLDFETQASYELCVRTTDRGAETLDRGFTVTVNDNADLVINEVDSDTPGVDGLEFIELYDGGAGNSDLSGKALVLFDGASDSSYRAIDLDGQSTDVNGYFVIGNAPVLGVGISIPDGSLQNGADAVALYADDAASFPDDTALTTTNLLDALVYDTGQPDDPGLLALLNGGQLQVDEAGSGDREGHSMQRLPNGSGGARNTGSYSQIGPTPGRANDAAPPSVSAIVRAGADPSNADAVDFTAVFSGAVVGVDSGDFSLATGGSAAGTVGPVAGAGASYTVTVTNVTGDGTLRLDLVDDDSISNGAHPLGPGDGSFSAGESYNIDNTAPTAPAVSGITPTNDPTPAWSWTPGGGGNGGYRYKLDNADLESGATATTATGFTPAAALPDGLHTLYVQERDAAGNWSASGSHAIRVDAAAPSVTIDQAAGQDDPSSESPILFTVLFSEPVTGFTGADVILGGTAGATTAVVSGSGASYVVRVSGMGGDGSVTATVRDGAAQDAAANGSASSTSSDNSVQYLFDDDAAGISVTESDGTTVVSETGTGDSFTVVLDAPPLSNVVLSVAGGDIGEATVDRASLTFTPGDWDRPQTVSVTGVDDGLIDGTQTSTVTLSVDDAQSDDAFDPLADRIVNVDTTDDEAAGFTVTESAGATAVGESGTSDGFTLVLDAQPMVGVVITVVSGDTGEATVDQASLTFTAADWDQPRSVTVTGQDDVLIDGEQTTLITLGVDDAQSDDEFDPLADQTLSVTTSDDDTAGFTVTESNGSTEVSETGTVDTFTLVLDTQPTGDVVIDVISADTGEATVDPAGLTFTNADWDRPQSVTVTGVDDALVDGDQITTVTLSVDDAGSDDAFDGLAERTVSVTTLDDEVADIIVNPSGGLTTTESGGTDAFTVVLDAQPTADVTIDLMSSDLSEGLVSPGSLAFTPSNWSVAQTVTVTGLDDDMADGNIAYSIRTEAATSADPAFDGMDPADVAVINRDDEVRSYTGPTATGTGDATLAIAGGSCSLDLANTAFVATDGLALPPGVEFPHGAISFRIKGCPPGATVGVMLTFPAALDGALAWKLDAAGDPAAISGAVIDGNRVSYSITDGGLLDQDGLADGNLSDPVAAGLANGPATSVPTLDEWGRWMLAAMLLLAGWRAAGERLESGWRAAGERLESGVRSEPHSSRSVK